jgi:hypothetical protein
MGLGKPSDRDWLAVIRLGAAERIVGWFDRAIKLIGGTVVGGE